MASNKEFGMPRGRKFGRVSRQNVAALVQTPARGVRRLAKTTPGVPGAPMLKPQPPEGRRSMRILSKQDPSLGGKYVEADARTVSSTKTDIGTRGGYRGVRVLSKVTGAVASNRGSRVIKPANALRGLKKR